MRALVLSDIHSNLEALEAVLQDAGPVDQVWCLGDVVGYGPDPNACVTLLRSLSPVCVAGNHDWATLGKLDLEEFNQDARKANQWNREELSPDNLSFLHSLPETVLLHPFTLAHGSPCHPIWEYVLYPTTARAAFDCFETPYCLVGHTHVPTCFRLTPGEDQDLCEQSQLPDRPMLLGSQRVLLNPGSVGQPRDGDPRASYIMLDLDTLTIEHHRVSYAIDVTQAKMVQRKLPTRLVLRLSYGW